MKKTLIICAALTVAGISSFAQGNIQFGGSIHTIYNNYTTPGTPSFTSGIDVTLLFSPTANASALAAISSTGSAANGSTSYTAQSAWNNIATDLSGSWFNVDGTTGTPLVASITGTAGTFTYNGNTAWAAADLTAGTAYTVYEIAWNTDGGLYNTLAAAEAADTAVGWGQLFSYTPTSGNTGPVLINNGLAGSYSVGGVAATPEPTTIALAGLGIAGLVALRRKK